MLHKLYPYALVAVGGMLGANARYILANWIGSALGARLPLGTFVINLTGAFALGAVGAVLAHKLVAWPDEVRLMIGVGFIGAYTTFSTFCFESHALFEDGAWMSAILNLMVSPILGLFAVHLGIVLMRRWMH